MTRVATLTQANVVPGLGWRVVRFHITDPVDRSAVLAVAELAARSEPRCGSTTVVAVDGHSGAGKTTFAAELGQVLGCDVVHLDSLYPGWDGLVGGVERLTAEVLGPLARGEVAAYRRWDWERDGLGEIVHVPAERFLLVEGAGASAGEAGRYAAVRVWVEADEPTRRHRGIARDGAAYAPHWQRWAAQEAALFNRDGTRARADVYVDTSP